jgi:hypothetical protein
MVKGVWLEVAIGTENVLSNNQKKSLLSLFNLKYAFQKERRFSIGE